MSVLVGYATRYGSTQEVAEAIAVALHEMGIATDLKLLREVRSLAAYSAVVIGAPLFMFRWHKDALRFLSRHHKDLLERPVAVFALGPTHDPYDEKEWQDSRAQLDRELGFPIKMLAGDVPASDIRDWEAIRTWVSRW